MAFQTPITIDKALQAITTHEYVLPAIQREFVWKPEQICAFFDSLMRRYPIGSFLFWEIPTAALGLSVGRPRPVKWCTKMTAGSSS